MSSRRRGAHAGAVAAGLAEEQDRREAARLEAAAGVDEQLDEAILGQRDRAGLAHVAARRIPAAFGHIGDDRRDERLAERARDLVGGVLHDELVLAVDHVRAPRGWQPDARTESQLRQLFPGAASFSAKGGEPPHFKVYDQRQTITGVCVLTDGSPNCSNAATTARSRFWWVSIRKGFSPVSAWSISNEPYGNFSVDVPAFPAQFRGKNIRDPFKVGADIRGLARDHHRHQRCAAIRNGARRVARQLLVPPGLSF